MYCNHCGTETPDGAAFCSTCGVDLSATTPMAAIEVFEPETDLDLVRSALKDEYDVKEEIGRGGMATVYRAEETGLARQVAIKVLPFSHTHDQSLVERFQLEARTAAKLEHPNIIPIYRVGQSGRVIYFTMRFLQGPSLSELIGEMGPMEPEQIRRMLTEAALALGHAHRSGVVHRDIKPDNIMFKDNGEAVLCDFGIAKAASGTGLTGTGMAIGTPYYMSPEQVRAKPLSGASDIYSLGVVAYQCLTTRVPFDGDDSFAIGYKHVMEDAPVPELPSDDHRALWDIIRNMMEKHETDRFGTAEELIAALTGERLSIPMTQKQPAATMPRASIPATVESPRQTAAPHRASVHTPTTPVPRITIEAPGPDEKAARKRSPLRIAAMLFGGFFGVVGAGAGGGYYYLENGGEIPPALRQYEPALRERAPWLASSIPLERWMANGQPVVVDSTEAADTLSVVAMDSLALDSAVVDSTLPVDTLAADTAAADSTPVPVEPVTGTLRLEGLGNATSVWINDQRVTGLEHQLEPGEYRLRVVAPGFERYNATVQISAGAVNAHRPEFRRRSQCVDYGETYNRNGECFDTRARVDATMSTLVPIDGTVPRQPTTPVVLMIQVQADGAAGNIIVQSPSDVPEFAILAVNYARRLSYEPAVKDGRPVAAWTSIALHARP